MAVWVPRLPKNSVPIASQFAAAADSAGWQRAASGRRSPGAAATAAVTAPLRVLACAPLASRRGLSVRAEADANGNGSTSAADGGFDYDLFCIGAGSGGVRASRVAAGTYGERWAAECATVAACIGMHSQQASVCEF